MTLNSWGRFVVTFLPLVVLLSCQAPREDAVNSLIPKPREVTTTGKRFPLKETASIVIASNSDELKSIAGYLADKLKPSTGYQLPLSTGQPSPGDIVLALKEDSQLGEEGYELTITEDQVKLTAPAPAGLFHGVQTIRQLLPAAIESASVQSSAEWIRDADLDKLKHGVEKQVKEHPARSLLVALGAGYLIGKILRR